MPEDSIVHQHYHASDGLIDVLDEKGIDVVTTLRDPYDQFVSLYFYVQRFRNAFEATDDPAGVMIDRDISDEAVLSFLGGPYGRYLEQGVRWLHSGHSTVVRYEDLVMSPEQTVLTLTERIGPVDPQTVRRSLEAAHPDRMRAQSPELRLHIRSATAGDWANHLTVEHLEAMARHESLILELGYPVRTAADLAS